MPYSPLIFLNLLNILHKQASKVYIIYAPNYVEKWLFRKSVIKCHFFKHIKVLVDTVNIPYRFTYNASIQNSEHWIRKQNRRLSEVKISFRKIQSRKENG